MPYLQKLWDLGEKHLAAGRYVAARRELEAAEGLAWRRHDAGAMARLYLPLLEARRQIRLSAVEGIIVIGAAAGMGKAELETFLGARAGTLVCCGSVERAVRLAGTVRYVAAREGSCLETLVLVERHGEWRLASAADATFAGGLEVGAGKTELPGAGVWDPVKLECRAEHAKARESLVLAWEALALRWQERHPLHVRGPSEEAAWDEIGWLRLALRVDPACEPVAMRVMAVAEALARGR